MKFKMIHENYNVADLDKAMRFYEEALGLREIRRKTGDDFIIVYMGNDESEFELELTWLKDHPESTTSEKRSSISLSAWTILRRRIRNMRKWAASAWRIPRWVFTSSWTRTATGWRSCQREIKTERTNEAERWINHKVPPAL